MEQRGPIYFHMSYGKGAFLAVPDRSYWYFQGLALDKAIREVKAVAGAPSPGPLNILIEVDRPISVKETNLERHLSPLLDNEQT